MEGIRPGNAHGAEKAAANRKWESLGDLIRAQEEATVRGRECVQMGED